MLAVMFSGRHHATKGGDGRYFIDRDGTHFRYILNYLRDGNTYIPVDNQQVIDELYEEVTFYNIHNLQEKLDSIKATGYNKIEYTRLLHIINQPSGKPVQMPNLKLAFMLLNYLDLSHFNMRGCDFSNV